jgi:maleate cis-trans isomerase
LPQFRLHVVIDAFEAHIGQAARHSTQAVFWRLLRLAGITTPITGLGRLLRER